MIGLYTPTQNTLEGIIFMYAFRNANISGIYTVEDPTSVVRMIGDFLSAQFDENGQKEKVFLIFSFFFNNSELGSFFTIWANLCHFSLILSLREFLPLVNLACLAYFLFLSISKLFFSKVHACNTLLAN